MKPHVPASLELRDALNEFGWTQKVAAEHLGVHPNTVQRWCSGGLPVAGPALAFIRLYRKLWRMTR